MINTKITYFGNKLSNHGKAISVIETLEPLLNEICIVKTYSSKKSKLSRMIDMLFHFFSEGIFSNKIMIDVYSTSAFYFALILGCLSFIFRKKYILFLHGGNLPFRYENNKKTVQFLFSNAANIIAPSNYLKYFFDEKGYFTTYIPNSIELQFYPFIERKKAQPKLLAIRGFGKPYNPLMTLKAIQIVKEKYPAVELLLLGNEDEYFYDEVINFIHENKLEKNIQVKPKMSRDEWVKLSMNYDIMISNPDIDNTPISILEGMALGMCIISTNVGGIPFLVENKKEVLTVFKNNEIELANAIIKLIENQNLANQLSINAHAKANMFDWKILKNKWKNILLN